MREKSRVQGQETQRLVIEGWHPPQTQNGAHGHWAAAAGRRKFAKLTAWTYIQAASLRHVCPPVAVEAVYVYPRRYRVDPDNLAARLKPVLDALVAAGVLADDSTEHITLAVGMRVEKGRKALELTLEPCGGAAGEEG